MPTRSVPTRPFIVRNADWIGEISLQIFNLDMVSPMYRDPARFGVVDDPVADDNTPDHGREDERRHDADRQGVVAG